MSRSSGIAREQRGFTVVAVTRSPSAEGALLPLEPAETTWDATPAIPDDGKGPAWGRKLRDYDPEFWREVSELHRSGNHEMAERAVQRGNVRPMKPATSIGEILSGLAFSGRRGS